MSERRRAAVVSGKAGLPAARAARALRARPRRPDERRASSPISSSPSRRRAGTPCATRIPTGAGDVSVSYVFSEDVLEMIVEDQGTGLEKQDAR